MQFTFIIHDWPFRKYNNQVVIIISNEGKKSLILDQQGDYNTIETTKLKEVTREYVEKMVIKNQLFREICSDEGLIEVKYQDSIGYLSYISSYM